MSRTDRIRPRVVALRVTLPSDEFGLHTRGVEIHAFADLPMPPEYREDADWVEEFGDQMVGYVSVASARHDQDIDMIRDECEQSLAALTKMLRRRRLPLFVVQSSEVRPAFAGTGLGVEMYVEAARMIARKYRGAMAPDYCVGGSTSEMALRVWNSKRMNEAVVRVGDVVYWKRRSRAVTADSIHACQQARDRRP
jgi:GNAT superfamily N-acetyltransferase